jgi:hypothetical protein
MIPSFRWFPTSLAARAAWYLNFYTQFAIVGPSLGFTAAEITGVSDDNLVMQFLADIFNQIKAYESAMTQYRKIITEGDIGDPTPGFPGDPTFALPKEIATGLFERLNDLRDRIMVAPAYTDETGALLGILPGTPDPISPADVKPSIQVFAAATGYMFSVVVADRADSNMWEVFIMRKGAANWTSAGSYTGKSADVTVLPTTPGDAEQMQVRVQLKKNNANYGQPSDVVYVTVNP